MNEEQKNILSDIAWERLESATEVLHRYNNYLRETEKVKARLADAYKSLLPLEEFIVDDGVPSDVWDQIKKIVGPANIIENPSFDKSHRWTVFNKTE